MTGELANDLRQVGLIWLACTFGPLTILWGFMAWQNWRNK